MLLALFCFLKEVEIVAMLFFMIVITILLGAISGVLFELGMLLVVFEALYELTNIIKDIISDEWESGF